MDVIVSGYFAISSVLMAATITAYVRMGIWPRGPVRHDLVMAWAWPVGLPIHVIRRHRAR